MTKFRSELGITPSPMGIHGIDVPDSYPHLYPHFSRSCVSPPLAPRQFICASRAEHRASATKASLWERRSKYGVTPSFGIVRDRVDDSRAKAPGKQVFPSINFTQETQNVAPPQQMRALQSSVPESAPELLSHGLKALLDHDGESQHVPMIASTNCRHRVERIAE